MNPLSISSSSAESEFLAPLLVQWVIDMQKNKKASNPQMIIKKILEQIKPKYVKCIAIICKLLDQYDSFINQGEEEKIINEVLEEFSDRWQENDEGQHLQEIRYQIINHPRSLSLLLFYQQILDENARINHTYINPNDLEYLIELDLVVSSEEKLKVSNDLYKKVFNNDYFLKKEIKNKINKLVETKWQFNEELRGETKPDITGLIAENLLPLSTKTNNLETLISLILEWSKRDDTLLKLLINSITESQERILLNDNNQEARESFNNFVKTYLTDNWQENPFRESFDYFNSLQNQLLNNQKCDVFWLLFTYFYALQGNKFILNFQQEFEELLNLQLVLYYQSPEGNKLAVANNIYQEILNENWVLTQLTHLAEKLNCQHLLDWLKSEQFEQESIIITDKFSNNYKEIFEEIISWTGEHQTLTTKIVHFVDVGIVEVKSEDINWFNQNIMYSPNLGKFVNENEFQILIGNRISQLEVGENTNQLHQNMQRLTKKFKHNPLIIVNEVLENTQSELKSTINLIDLILSEQLPEQYRIDTEADVGKIPELLNLDATINPSNIEKSPIMAEQNNNDQPKNIDDLLDEIIEQAKAFLKAIILVNLKQGEVVDHRYNKDESDKSSGPEPLYKKLIGRSSGGVAVEDFGTLVPTIETFKKFAEETNAGELEYSIYVFTEGLVIGAFLNIGGTYYGVFYIGKSGVARAKLVNLCERTVPEIKNAFEADPYFN